MKILGSLLNLPHRTIRGPLTIMSKITKSTTFLASELVFKMKPSHCYLSLPWWVEESLLMSCLMPRLILSFPPGQGWVSCPEPCQRWQSCGSQGRTREWGSQGLKQTRSGHQWQNVIRLLTPVKSKICSVYGVNGSASSGSSEKWFKLFKSLDWVKLLNTDVLFW